MPVPVTIRGRREALWMPPAAKLLAGGRVLGAHDPRTALLPFRDAYIAADALADVLETPLSSLAGRKGSAIEGRAAPTMSHCPSRTSRTIVSGLVNRPTLITGLLV
jgi:hypothetical protein